MSKKMWIIVLVAAGVGIALLVGFAGRSQSVAEKQFCDSLSSLESSVNNLTSLDAKTATQGEFQSDVNNVQNDWNSTKSAAQNLHSVNMSSLDDAWNSYAQAVKNIPSDASVSDAESDISQSAQGLASAVKSSIDSHDCSTSS